MNLKVWIEAIRPRTLPVSAASVIMASAVATINFQFKWLPTLLCLAFAILAQIVSNLANEYYDFLRGTDKQGLVGPRRGVTEGDIEPNTLRNVTFATLALTCVVGCSLIPFGGWWLIPAGIVILLASLAYSTGPYPLSYHGLGEITVFLFYGVVPVNLSYYIMTGVFDAWALLASFCIGFMGVNVLLVNNYRDCADDEEAGKRTAVVMFGKAAAQAAYLINGYAAIGIMAMFWLYLLGNGWTWHIIPPIVYLIMHTACWQKLRSREGAALNPLLGSTARAMLIFTILFFIFTIYPSH